MAAKKVLNKKPLIKKILCLVWLVGWVIGGLSLATSCASVQVSNKTPFVESIVTEVVKYTDGETEMHGYIARPKDLVEKNPAVLVVHEWWGQTDYPRKRARQLAEQGYVAMAIDMFGDRKLADHPKKASEFTKQVMSDFKIAESRFKAAYKVLAEQEDVDEAKINALGYCFGGGVVLNMARKGIDFKTVISLHGSLPEGEFNSQDVKAQVLVMNGEKDPLVKAEDIERFKREMLAIPGEFKFINYPEAMHGFSNPEATAKGKEFDMPLKYNAQADEQSWAELKNFLSDYN